MGKSGFFITPEWRRFQARLSTLPTLASEMRRDIAGRIAGEALTRFRATIQRGGDPFTPLSAATIAMRETPGRTPLVDSGKLLNAATVTFDQDGVDLSFDRDPEAAQYGTVMEFGAHVTVTPGTRRYLASQGVHLRNDTKVLIVPPRPTITPTIEGMVDRVVEIAEEEIDKVYERAGL